MAADAMMWEKIKFFFGIIIFFMCGTYEYVKGKLMK